MATEIKIWEIADKKINPVQDTSLASQHVEDDLENWIIQVPEILGDEFLVIGRQLEIPSVGRLDLLCIDKTGKLVVVELKRDRPPREAVAQALDYASWLNDAGAEEILDHAKAYLDAELSEAFEEHFHAPMPDISPQNHKLLIVASRLDSSAERIVNYLRERYGIEFNVLLFKYAKISGEREVLVRTLLLPESTRPTGITRPPAQPTAEELMAIARDREIGDIVEVCRSLRGVLGWEQPRNTYGGSFRYWKRRQDGGYKMLFGVNVAGDLASAPSGKLDVWIRPRDLSDVSGVPEESIRLKLRDAYSVVKEQNDRCALRLSTREEAERLVSQLKDWAQQDRVNVPA